jgi:hypothetical protein
MAPPSMAPKWLSSRPADRHASSRGVSTHGKSSRLPSPQACNCNLAPHKSTRRISGSRKETLARSDASLQSRTHRPGPVRPARPARCVAEAAEIFSSTSRSRPTLGENRSTRANPLSMTVWTPGIVSDVSAILVETMIRLVAPICIACDCSSMLIEPCKGSISKSANAP